MLKKYNNLRVFLGDQLTENLTKGTRIQNPTSIRNYEHYVIALLLLLVDYYQDDDE